MIWLSRTVLQSAKSSSKGNCSPSLPLVLPVSTYTYHAIFFPFILHLLLNGTRYLDRLPSFELHGTGRTEKAFWREYSLKCPGVDCRLLEVFSRNLGDDNWICTPQDTIDWKVEMTSQDKITWVNRS